MDRKSAKRVSPVGLRDRTPDWDLQQRNWLSAPFVKVFAEATPHLRSTTIWAKMKRQQERGE